MSLLRRRMMMGETGGDEMIRGSFTPEEHTGNYTLTLPQSCENIIIRKHTFNISNLGYRGVLSADLVSDTTNIIAASNAAGTAWTLVTENVNEVTINGNKVTFSFINGRELINEQYDYIAW